MKNSSINQSRQTLFEAIVIYAKAPLKNGEPQVIYENNTIRNLNRFDKIKNSISNFFGYERSNKFKASIHSESAKESILNKLKINLLKKIPDSEEHEFENVINHVDLRWTIAENFFSSEISHIKRKENYVAQRSKSVERNSNSGFSEDQFTKLNSSTKKLEESSDAAFGHLPTLVKAVLDDPSIEKFVKILLENNDATIEASKLITMANQASRIKDALRCNSKKAVEYIKTLNFEEKDIDFYRTSIGNRVENFIQAKKKFNLNGESAKNYALLMENKILEKNKLNKIEMLNVVHDFHLIKNKSGKKIIFYSEEQLLEKTIRNHTIKKHYPSMKKFIKEKNDISDKKIIERHAIEMTDIAYYSLSKEQKYQAAKTFITDKAQASKENSEFIEKDRRELIAKYIQGKIETILPLDEERNYDPNIDKDYYERL